MTDEDLAEIIVNGDLEAAIMDAARKGFTGPQLKAGIALLKSAIRIALKQARLTSVQDLVS